jgi:hypothetical protein
MVLFLEGIFLAPKGTVVTTIDLLSIQQWCHWFVFMLNVVVSWLIVVVSYIIHKHLFPATSFFMFRKVASLNSKWVGIFSILWRQITTDRDRYGSIHMMGWATSMSLLRVCCLEQHVHCWLWSAFILFSCERCTLYVYVEV